MCNRSQLPNRHERRKAKRRQRKQHFFVLVFSLQGEAPKWKWKSFSEEIKFFFVSEAQRGARRGRGKRQKLEK